MGLRAKKGRVSIPVTARIVFEQGNPRLLLLPGTWRLERRAHRRARWLPYATATVPVGCVRTIDLLTDGDHHLTRAIPLTEQKAA